MNQHLCQKINSQEYLKFLDQYAADKSNHVTDLITLNNKIDKIEDHIMTEMTAQMQRVGENVKKQILELGKIIFYILILRKNCPNNNWICINRPMIIWITYLFRFKIL